MSVVSCLYWYHVVLVLWFSSPQFSPIRSLLSFPPRRSASNKPFLLSPPPNKQLIADVSSSNSRDGGRSIRFAFYFAMRFPSLATCLRPPPNPRNPA
ncbi:hypothetical protein GW17_00001835 [Ensete ventricosum]|nr:hypothetical protein GW17_00001835 [Ensete ventricosum]RZS14001.1 hypothetical protein BHM03_00045649 [Ensete ventricosum]